MSPSPLISHRAASADLAGMVRQARQRIFLQGDLPGFDVARQIELLLGLAESELGRFLLLYRGLNAEWTHRLVTHQPGSGALAPLERVFYERLPAVLATRERHGHFRRALQRHLRPGCVAASVPCGWMSELLALDYSACPGVQLVGIDYDPEALDGATRLAAGHPLAAQITLHRQDTWALDTREGYDLLTSNGLNIYEPDDARVTELYRRFWQALKPGGVLVTSFLTPPPALSPDSPWDMQAIDPHDLQLQQLVFTRLIQPRWNALRTHAQTRAQLEEAGFTDLRFEDDRARLFPTVIARKPA
ncbi:class I SAM-dependent methyltransferase [Bordetella pertussis]|uniref:SAM-dependent methyltransferase n=1 Tax=Bordetella pertussis TaxID=520 RepID=UPI00320B6C7A